MQGGGAPNGLGGAGNSGMSGPSMGGNNQGNQNNMSGNKTSTQVTIPKDVSQYHFSILYIKDYLMFLGNELSPKLCLTRASSCYIVIRFWF